MADDPVDKTRVVSPTEFEAARPLQSTAPTAANETPARPKPIVPDHELLRCVGQGAYGEVWLARNVVGTLRAVKVVYRDNFGDERPYEREFTGIKKFEPLSRSNDGFVNVLQIGRNDHAGYFYYVMELADDGGVNERRMGVAPTTDGDLETYVPKTLSSEISQRGRLPYEECLQLGISLNLALGHLHRHGLIHRDIKPSNIIFVRGIPKLADIGLVAEIREANTLVGTEGFLAPEGPNSPQADIYSLGKVLYEMSMGKDRQDFPEPFTGLAEAKDARALMELNAVVVKACAPDPRHRYQSAEEMNVDLALLQSGRSVKRKRDLERQLGLVKKGVAIAAVLAGLATAAFIYQRHQTSEVTRLRNLEAHQRREAETARTRTAEALSQAQLQRTEDFFDRGMADTALANLALQVRENPSNRIAAERLVSALAYRDFALPVIPPLQHSNGALTAQFSPDGMLIATGSDDTSWAHELFLKNRSGPVVRLWSSQTGQAVMDPMPHSASLISVQFSPDGLQLLTICSDNSARVWDVRTSRLLRSFELATNTARIKFSNDGSRLAACEKPGKAIQIFDVLTGQPLLTPLEHESVVRAMQFAPDGKKLLTVGRDKSIRLWDLDAAKPIVAWLAPETGDRVDNGAGQFIAFSPDGSQVVIAAGAAVCTWDTASGRQLAGPLEHKGTVRFAEFSPSSARLITTADKTACLWDNGSGELLAELRHDDEVTRANFSPNGLQVVTVSWDRTARIWNAFTGRALGEPIPHRHRVATAQFSSDGRYLLTASWDRTARVWDIRPGTATAGRLTNDFVAQLGIWSRNRERIVSTYSGTNFMDFRGDPKAARVWDLRTREPLTEPLRHEGEINTAQLSPDGRFIVTGSMDNTARIWEVATSRPLGEPLQHNGWVMHAEFSMDGLQVVTSSSDGIVQVWDARSGKPACAPLKHDTAVRAAHFSPQRQHVITLYGNDARVWRLPEGRGLGLPLGHDDDVVWARFSPDELRVVTVSKKRTIRVWNTLTGDPISEPLHIDATSDEVRVLTASRNHTMRLWNASSKDPISDSLHISGTAPVTGFGRSAENIVQDRWVPILEFSPDSSQILLYSTERRARTGADSGSRSWDVPALSSPAPVWLAEVAELLAGQRLNAQGMRDDQPVATLALLKQEVDASAASQPVVRWAQWLLADRGTRPISPDSPVSSAEYHRRLIEENTSASLTRALRMSPTNGAALASFALKLLPDGRANGSHKSLDAVWCSRYAATLASGDWGVWQAQAKIFDRIGDLKGAVAARRKAVELKPTGTNVLDLFGYFNARLDEDWLSPTNRGYNLGNVPRGIRSFDGVPFDVRGLVQLNSLDLQRRRLSARYPERVDGIQLNLKCQALHFLHGAARNAQENTTIGRYLIRYADAQEAEMSVVYGRDVRNWEFNPKSPTLSEAVPVWTGTQPGRQKNPNSGVRLYKSTWRNPRPNAGVVSIDFISNMTDSGPFLTQSLPSEGLGLTLGPVSEGRSTTSLFQG